MKAPGRGTATSPRGFAGWMARVIEECERAERGMTPAVVHDLRVALRRCRTMADSLARVDDSAGWARVKRAGRRLFRSLGELRDVQVMAEWTLRLGSPGDPVRLALLVRLIAREERLKRAADRELRRFPKSEWKSLARRLTARADRFRAHGAVFEELARHRLIEAWELHRKAASRATPAAWHALRIGCKRFRYVVENFLPRRHAEWGRDLKRVQDLLGEVHDLDVLRGELAAMRGAAPEGARKQWRARIEAERESRLTEYHRMSTGSRSVWSRWRAALPTPAAAASPPDTTSTARRPRPAANRARSPRRRPSSTK